MAIIFNEGREIVDRIVFDGLEISVEVKANSYRTGKDRKGNEWKQKVSAAYGYILGTNSPDGEHLDVWVRPKPKSGSMVYVIHQLSVDGRKYDEDKVMIGYPSRESAIAAFKENCFKPSIMYGGCSVFDMEHFKVVAYMASNSKIMIASQKMYDRFVEKGLMPRGIKSPIATSKIVKENFATANKSVVFLESADEALRIYHLCSPNAKVMAESLVFDNPKEMKSLLESIDKPSNVIPMTKPTISAIMEQIEFYTGPKTVEASVVDVLELDEKPFEYLMDIDMDKIVWRFTNTLIEFGGEDAADILEFVSSKACGGNSRFIQGYIRSNTGSTVADYADIIRTNCREKLTFDTFMHMLNDAKILHSSYSNLLGMAFKEICSDF